MGKRTRGRPGAREKERKKLMNENEEEGGGKHTGGGVKRGGGGGRAEVGSSRPLSTAFRIMASAATGRACKCYFC